jgi:hypothetical protein
MRIPETGFCGTKVGAGGTAPVAIGSDELLQGAGMIAQ